MGREIRRVPENWQHPKGKTGSYKPMQDYDFAEQLKEFRKDIEIWYQEYQEFENGKEFSYEDKNDKKVIVSKANGNSYQEWSDLPTPPNPYDYMPKGDWYQLFEDVSEGTPISPPFPTPEKLVEWLINNKDFWGKQWTKESAESIVRHGSAPSGIFDGRNFIEPHQMNY